MKEKAKIVKLTIAHKKPTDKVEAMKDIFIKNFIRKQLKKSK